MDKFWAISSRFTCWLHMPVSYDAPTRTLKHPKGLRSRERRLSVRVVVKTVKHARVPPRARLPVQ
jgi:hypothetical protein